MRGRRILPSGKPLNALLSAPASKSVTHRALVAAALGDGVSRLVGPLRSDDTIATMSGLSALGLTVVEERAGSWAVHGSAGSVPGGGVVDARSSGTTLRLLLAVAALGERPSRLDGSARLRERPIEELEQALRSLGARVVRPAGGFVEAGGIRPRGGSVRVGARRSSQFASALLLVGSSLEDGLDLALEGAPVSAGYLELTARVLESFGVAVERSAPDRFRVRRSVPRARELRIEGDHSSSAPLLAAAALVGGRVSVSGLDPRSAQPDAVLASILEHLGCAVRRGEDRIEVEGSGSIPGFEWDVAGCPDLAPILSVLLLFADGPGRLTGAGHVRLKESDRLAVMARALVRLGRPARVDGHGVLETGAPAGSPRAAPVATGSDHRIAMALAVAGLRLPGLEIDDADCVTKSYPGFWADFRALEG